MVCSIINIKDYLLSIANNRNFSSNICVFDSLSNYNEEIIELLISDYNVNFIDRTTTNIKLLYFDKVNEYYKNGYFIFQDQNDTKSYAINNIKFFKNIEQHLQNDVSVYLIKKQDFLKILESDFAKENTHFATHHMENMFPNLTAKTVHYFNMLFGFIIIFFSALSLFPNIFAIINNFIYFIQNILKITLLKYGSSYNKPSSIEPITDHRPIYSILVPLYREEFKIKSILQAIDKINYPKTKLDVKFIIEEDDILTMKALIILDIPSYIHVIKVPYSIPRTKPKALNYAISYVKGEFLAIYDAEDEPDPDQILKALDAFYKLPEHFICVQAKLNFYNMEDNILTYFFAMEYIGWFEFLIRGRSMISLPITLGGTSNHFKVKKLKEEIGFWDAYNVTEDADIGIRLYSKGYKVHLIDSTTMEEAPDKLSVWLAQRARWIKGFIQTIFVFINNKEVRSKLGVINSCYVYLLVGFASYGFLCWPWLLIILFVYEIHPIIYYAYLINAMLSCAYIYYIGYLSISYKKSFTNILPSEWIRLIFWPLYFILHTIASYRAIWELFFTPFKWNKTPHGKTMD